MKAMNRFGILFLIICVILSGCTFVSRDGSQAQTPEVSTVSTAVEAPVPTLLSSAYAVLETLKNQDMAGFSKWAHPVEGVRFSPYTYVNVTADLVFKADQLVGLMADQKVMTWGSFDGSGEPIALTPSEYFKKFVYDKDYLMPQMIGLNKSIGQGNSINNLAEAYPDAEFVEFHFAGFDPQFEGMDWSSLVVVMRAVEGKWYVVGIIHMSWTI